MTASRRPAGRARLPRSRKSEPPLSRTAWVLFALALSAICLFAAEALRRHVRLVTWQEELERTSDAPWPMWQRTWAPLSSGAIASDDLRGAYAYAALNADRVRFIPCYCGCVREAHGSVLDCFVKGFSSEGRPLWTDHAFTCRVCVSIMREVALMSTRGMSLGAIRNAIDRYHPDMLRTPTRTPLPQ